MAVLAVLDARLPILWAACVMSNCKDDNPVFICGGHKGERKVFDEDAASIARARAVASSTAATNRAPSSGSLSLK